MKVSSPPPTIVQQNKKGDTVSPSPASGLGDRDRPSNPEVPDSHGSWALLSQTLHRASGGLGLGRARNPGSQVPGTLTHFFEGRKGVAVCPFQGSGHSVAKTLSPVNALCTGEVKKPCWEAVGGRHGK